MVLLIQTCLKLFGLFVYNLVLVNVLISGLRHRDIRIHGHSRRQYPCDSLWMQCLLHGLLRLPIICRKCRDRIIIRRQTWNLATHHNPLRHGLTIKIHFTRCSIFYRKLWRYKRVCRIAQGSDLILYFLGKTRLQFAKLISLVHWEIHAWRSNRWCLLSLDLRLIPHRLAGFDFLKLDFANFLNLSPWYRFALS